MQLLPQCFNGIVGSPECGDTCSVCFKLSACDGPIGCVEMHEHCHNGDISEAKGVVVQGRKIEAVNSCKKLFFHFFLHGGGEDEFHNSGLENADSFVDLKLHHIGRDDGVIAQMDLQLKSNASCYHVFGNGHDKANMAMATAPMC